MARNTHRTLSPDLFSHQIIWFVLGVSLHNSETSGNHALENLETGAGWQKQYFPPVKAGYFQTQTWQKDILAHFVLITTTALVKYLSFLKETGWLTLIANKSSDSTNSPNQGNNNYASHHSQNTVTWPFFPHGMVECVLGVSYTALKHQGNTFIVNRELGPDEGSTIFFLWELDSCSLKSARKILRFSFLFTTTTILVYYLSGLK